MNLKTLRTIEQELVKQLDAVQDEIREIKNRVYQRVSIVCPFCNGELTVSHLSIRGHYYTKCNCKTGRVLKDEWGRIFKRIKNTKYNGG